MPRSSRAAEYVNQLSFAELKQLVGSGYEDALRSGIAEVFANLGTKIAQAIIEGEVEQLCGAKHSRKGQDQPVRWGSQDGIIQVRGTKERIKKPRVRTADRKFEIDLETYCAFNQKQVFTDAVLAQIGSGVSTRAYASTLQKDLRKAGVSKSAVSRKVIAGTKQALDAFINQRWHHRNFVAILIDGVRLGKVHVVAAVGIDKSGQKQVLGWQLGSTESAVVCRDLIRRLADCGLSVDQDYLFVLDGSKALAVAIRERFGDNAVIQRCQEHKIRDVENYLPVRWRKHFRLKLHAAFNEPTLTKASLRLECIRKELMNISEPAANSLVEGLSNTLTLHRLGINGSVRESLRTTNIIESAFSRLRQHTRNVANWSDCNQVNRWLAHALQKVQKGYRRVPGYRQLSKLQRQVTAELTALQSPKS
jgi:transposase-like protein